MSEFVQDGESSSSNDKPDVEKSDSASTPLSTYPLIHLTIESALVAALTLADFDVSTLDMPWSPNLIILYRIPTLVRFLVYPTPRWRLTPALDKDAAAAGILEDDSPYPEVRSAVANTDDETIPVGTMRSLVLGVIWAIILPVCLEIIITAPTSQFFPIGPEPVFLL
jgi:hypothetical protein